MHKLAEKLYRRTHAPRRAACVLLAFLLLLATLATGTYAWMDLDQHKTHEFETGLKLNNRTAELILMAKVRHPDDAGLWVETQEPVEGAEFHLYRVEDGGEIRVTGVEAAGYLDAARQPGRFITNEKGEVLARNLPPGQYYFLAAIPSPGYAHDRDDTNQELRQYHFELKAEDTAVTVEAFERRMTATLALTKTVENQNNHPLSPAQLEQEFIFTVVFGDGGSYPYTVEGGEEQQITSGGVIPLKHGQTALITDVPVGLQYRITETPVPGYHIQSNGSAGNISATGGDKAEFINVFEDTGTLEITKQVTGPGADTEKLFEFTVNFAGGGEYPYTIDGKTAQMLAGGDILRLKHGQTALFYNLPVGLAYTVTEADYSSEGYIASVGQAQGSITPQGARALFVNQKQPGATAGLQITKQVTGDAAELDKAFVFTITFSDNGTYEYTIDSQTDSLASGGTLTLKHGQTAIFTALPVGVVYTVEEQDYRADGYISATQKASGALTLAGASLLFVNEKNQTPPAGGSLHITKEVGGEGADIEKKFEFTVVFSDGGTYDYTIEGRPHSLASGQTLTLKHGQTAAFETLPVGIAYTVAEQDYSGDGYTAMVSLAEGTIIAAGTRLLFVNEKQAALPTVGGLHITKEVAGEEADPDKAFAFTVELGDGNAHEYTIGGQPHTLPSGGKLTLKQGQTAAFANLPAGITYTIAEDDYSGDGYIPTPRQVSGTILGGETVITRVVNEKLNQPPDTPTTLVVTKEVVGEPPEQDREKEFLFTIVLDGAEEQFALKHGQQKEFALPKGTVYEVYEADYFGEGYAGSITNASGVAQGQRIEAVQTNTYTGVVTVEITGEKTWNLAQNPDAALPGSIAVQLVGNGVVVENAAVQPGPDGKWTYGFTAPRYGADGAEIGYAVREVEIPGFTVGYNGYNIVNTAVEPVEFTPTVKKELTGGSPKTDPTFQFVLAATAGAPLPGGSANNHKITAIKGAGQTDFGAISFSLPGTYIYTIQELNDGEERFTYDTAVYTLAVVVVDAGDKLKLESAVYTRENGAVAENALFRNHYEAEQKAERETVVINGEKRWVHGSNPKETQPDSIIVYVRQGGNVVAAREVTEKDDWHWSFRLDKYGENGDELIYAVDEADLPDYTKTIDGYNITNRHASALEGETIVVAGQKHWEHGDNPEATRPRGITVHAMQNGQVVATQTVTAHNNWQYSFTLPKYNEQGLEVRYAIDEDPVPGYGKYVEGYDLVNSYGYADGHLPSQSPQTDDPNKLCLWFMIMIGSGIVPIYMLIHHHHRRRGHPRGGKKRRSCFVPYSRW